MRYLGPVYVGLLLFSIAGCANVNPSPSGDSTTARPSGGDSVGLETTAIAFGPVIGAWRPAPIHLGDPEIAVISDACATAARDQLGEPEANLPTAVVDARGENVATSILADEERAIECRVRIDSGGTATVDGVARLAPSMVAPVAAAGISVSSLTRVPDREGGRMLLIGRVGSNASSVGIGFDDGTQVIASSANAWYTAWWPGHVRMRALDAIDAGYLVIASGEIPAGEVDARMGAASWWLDPRAPAPTPDSTSIRGFVREEGCASGKSPEGRLEGPLFDLTETDVTVTFGVRPLPGAQDCQANAAFPVTFNLPEPLAERILLDGNGVPPRDAAKPPAS
jgi:hypothetical protein